MYAKKALGYYRSIARINRKRKTIVALLFAIPFFVARLRTSSYEFLIDPIDVQYPQAFWNLTEYVHSHAAQSDLPVYVFYPTLSTGQLNNQLITLLNALCIAHAINGTVVAPPAHYGAESYRDYLASKGWHMRILYTVLGYLRVLPLGHRDTLVGDYIDAEKLNALQPVVDVDSFLASRGGEKLRSMRHILVRSGEAGDYHAMLRGQVHIGSKTTIEEPLEKRGEMNVASRRELDCEFALQPYFRGVAFRAGINANFVFLPRIFRTHVLNCAKKDPYWMFARSHIQPRAELRKLVAERSGAWGSYIAIHLRFLPYDTGKFTSESYMRMVIHRFKREIQDANFVYVAHSVTCKTSVDIVRRLRDKVGPKIITASVYGNIYKHGAVFDKRYVLPLIDMWTCVKSHYFIGRSASSLSTNVRHWREALDNTNSSQPLHYMYTLEDFSPKGEVNHSDGRKRALPYTSIE